MRGMGMFAPADDEDVALSRPILAPCAAAFDSARRTSATPIRRTGGNGSGLKVVADVLVLRVCGDEAAQNTKVVRHRRDPTTRRFRRNLDRVEWRSRHQSKSGRGVPSALWLSDDRAEQCRRPDPPKGDAGHIDAAGGM